VLRLIGAALIKHIEWICPSSHYSDGNVYWPCCMLSCWPLMSHIEYAPCTLLSLENRWTDTRQMLNTYH